MSSPKVETSPVRQANPIRVMLVDDHPLIRAGVKFLLDAEHDLRVMGEASNGEEAIQLARDIRLDVIVMDVSLPEVGGAEATERILAEQPEIRILALSVHEDMATAQVMCAAGAAGYLLKRRTGDEVVHAVRTLAAGDTYIDPTLTKEMKPQTAASRRKSPRGIQMTSLSTREAEVVRLTAQGHSAKEIAQVLQLSPRTLETYKARAMAKLKIYSRVELVRYALRCGWLRDA